MYAESNLTEFNCLYHFEQYQEIEGSLDFIDVITQIW
jgi:hypothetical protein